MMMELSTADEINEFELCPTFILYWSSSHNRAYWNETLQLFKTCIKFHRGKYHIRGCSMFWIWISFFSKWLEMIEIEEMQEFRLHIQQCWETEMNKLRRHAQSVVVEKKISYNMVYKFLNQTRKSKIMKENLEEN